MIVGYHIVFGAYGFWLPNDPRGSWSTFVGSWELFRYGPATKTTERTSAAYREHDHALRLAAKKALQRPAVEFSDLQVRAVGLGFAAYFERAKVKVPVWACAILPDHVHLVIGQPEMDVEQLVIQLKGAATESLKEQGIHPFGQMKDKKGRTPKCFARGEWKVYLDPGFVPRAIRYVEENPVKEGKQPQRWPFVSAYQG
jgi:REP element-mobilizing transposase RayT